MPNPCSVPDCDRPSIKYGYCNMHAKRMVRAITLLKKNGKYKKGMPIDVGGPEELPLGRGNAPITAQGVRAAIAQEEQRIQNMKDTIPKLEERIKVLHTLLKTFDPPST